MSDNLQSFYKLLEVTPQSSAHDIKKSYHRLAKQWHPDKHSNKQEAEEKFKQIKHAYEELITKIEKKSVTINYNKENFHQPKQQFDTYYEANTRFGLAGWFNQSSKFGHSCTFGPGSRFSFNNSFDYSCAFDPGCTFDSYATFGNSCAFGPGCVFNKNSSFGNNCSFGPGCAFNSNCTFGLNCYFGPGCRFKGRRRFGVNCDFGVGCKV